MKKIVKNEIVLLECENLKGLSENSKNGLLQMMCNSTP